MQLTKRRVHIRQLALPTLGLFCFIFLAPHITAFESLLFTFSPILPSDIEVTEKCPNCCTRARDALHQLRVEERNIWCFHLDFKKTPAILRFNNLTYFDPLYSHYLSMAKVFLTDVGRTGQLRGEIIWRIEDDSTLPFGFIDWTMNHNVVVVGHSIKKSSKVANLYTSLVPNFHFIESRGFEQLLKKREPNSFASRNRTVFWAGSTTGICDGDCFELKRVKLVQESQSVMWLAFHISGAIQCCLGRQGDLMSKKLFGARVEEQDWVHSRGVIDIDGNVDAWGQRWRFASGSVVFMVESSYVNMYSGHIRDGVHYISVSADLRELASVTSVVLREEMDSELERISNNAADLMRTHFTYEKVCQVVAKNLYSMTM